MLQKPNLNKPVFKMFPEQKKLVEQGKCPICSKEIKETDFEDDLSKKEFTIAGMCQECQHKTFN